MHSCIEKILITENQISTKVKELADIITKEYTNKDLLLIGILNGSYIFLSDLSRHISIDHNIEFMKVSSYGDGKNSSGNLDISLDLQSNIENRDVIIVEDIIDSGNTLYKLNNYLLQKKPASLKICTLLNKPSRRLADIKADIVGFEVDDHFIVGYGLDYAQKYRNLPYIGILKD